MVFARGNRGVCFRPGDCCLIRWITDRLGTAPYEQVGRDGGHFVLDVRHLVDKRGNPCEEVLAAIQAGAAAMRRGQAVVVACDFGISRSNAIAAGVLSVVEQKPYREAIKKVIAATGESEIKLDMVDTVRIALGEKSEFSGEHSTLITGAGGFIGSHLFENLQQTGAVRGPPRSQLDLLKGVVPLEEYCRQSGIRQIVHLAYPHVFTNAAAGPAGLQMLRAVLDVCRSLNLRLIYVSDRVVYDGYASPGVSVDEDAPLSPKGAYGDSKFLEEMLVDLYHRRGEIGRTVCRFTNVYGPGGKRPRLISAFHAAALEGRKIVTHRYRNGRPALDLLYITDAVDALARVAARPVDGVFHFGTGRLSQTAEIAAQIGHIAGRSLSHSELDIDDDVGNIAFQSKKAREVLGWVPRVELSDGLKAMLTAKSPAQS